MVTYPLCATSDREHRRLKRTGRWFSVLGGEKKLSQNEILLLRNALKGANILISIDLLEEASVRRADSRGGRTYIKEVRHGGVFRRTDTADDYSYEHQGDGEEKTPAAEARLLLGHGWAERTDLIFWEQPGPSHSKNWQQQRHGAKKSVQITSQISICRRYIEN